MKKTASIAAALALSAGLAGAASAAEEIHRVEVCGNTATQGVIADARFIYIGTPANPEATPEKIKEAFAKTWNTVSSKYTPEDLMGMAPILKMVVMPGNMDLVEDFLELKRKDGGVGKAKFEGIVVTKDEMPMPSIRYGTCAP